MMVKLRRTTSAHSGDEAAARNGASWSCPRCHTPRRVAIHQPHLDFFDAVNAADPGATGGTLQAVICQRMWAHDCRQDDAGDGNHDQYTGTVKKLIEENRLDKLAAAIETGTDDGMLNFNQSLFQSGEAGQGEREKTRCPRPPTRRRWR